MQFEDQLNRIVYLPKTPSRIVSLVPSQTELLVDLGLRDKLVGITKFCVHPKSLRKEIVVVGGTKKVNFEKIKDLQPDLIICNKEENTQEMVKELEKISTVWITDIYSIEDCLEMIKIFGEIFQREETAHQITSNIITEKESFIDFMKGKPFKKTVYIIWKNPYMAAGQLTFINELMKLNHFENIVEVKNPRYPNVDLGKLEELDLILLSSEPYPFKNKDALKLEKKLKTKTKLVDGEFFSWYGSRLQKAFTYFKTLH